MAKLPPKVREILSEKVRIVIRRTLKRPTCPYCGAVVGKCKPIAISMPNGQ